MRNDFPYSIEQLEFLSTGNGIQVEQKDDVFILGLGITSRCNLNCPKCYYRSSSQKINRDLSVSTIEEILKNCSKLRSVNLALEGEPFCHPNILSILDLTNEYSNAISISTNATSLTTSLIKDISDKKFNLFTISIDADKKNEYELFQKGSSWDKFLKNATLLSDTFGRKVGFTTVLYSENLDHIQGLPEIAKKIGISYINIMQLRGHDFATLQGVTVPEESALLSSLYRFLENANKYEVPVYIDTFFGNKRIMEKIRSLRSKSIIVSENESNVECTYPWFYTSILSDGSLFPCCGDFKPMKLDSFTFNNIYNHKYLQLLRYLIRQNKIPIACKMCHHKK